MNTIVKAKLAACCVSQSIFMFALIIPCVMNARHRQQQRELKLESSSQFVLWAIAFPFCHGIQILAISKGFRARIVEGYEESKTISCCETETSKLLIQIHYKSIEVARILGQNIHNYLLRKRLQDLGSTHQASDAISPANTTTKNDNMEHSQAASNEDETRQAIVASIEEIGPPLKLIMNRLQEEASYAEARGHQCQKLCGSFLTMFTGCQAHLMEEVSTAASKNYRDWERLRYYYHTSRVGNKFLPAIERELVEARMYIAQGT